ncbi:hypothetical protein WT37_04320 [Burkholderia territorii]|nr:hypothetical protein WT37_04320 [Burkholderia territorii]
MGTVFELVAQSASLWYEKIEGFVTQATRAVSAPSAARITIAWSIIGDAAGILASLAFFAALMAIVSTWPQSRFIISTKALSKGFEKLNPASGIKGLFGVQKLLMLVLGPMKIGVLACVLVLHVLDEVPVALQLFYMPVHSLGISVGSFYRDLEHRALAVFLVFATLDYVMQRFMFRRQLKMDHQDMKDEYKQMEGDPHAKGHRKAIAKQLVNDIRPVQTGKPNVVVVNPHHIAVALAYAPSTDALPIIVLKGTGHRADEIRKWARENRIPMIRYVKLARILYGVGREGDHIPSIAVQATAVLYQAVRDLAASGVVAIDDRIELPEIDPKIGDEMFASQPPKPR